MEQMRPSILRRPLRHTSCHKESAEEQYRREQVGSATQQGSVLPSCFLCWLLWAYQSKLPLQASLSLVKTRLHWHQKLQHRQGSCCRSFSPCVTCCQQTLQPINPNSIQIVQPTTKHIPYICCADLTYQSLCL